MSGFNPVGSAPIAAIGSGLAGTIVSPGLGSVTIAGFIPTLSGTDPVNIGSIEREVLFSETGTVKVGTVVREVLRDPETTAVKANLIVREVLRDPELIAARASFIVREVLISGPRGGGGSISILW